MMNQVTVQRMIDVSQVAKKIIYHNMMEQYYLRQYLSNKGTMQLNQQLEHWKSMQLVCVDVVEPVLVCELDYSMNCYHFVHYYLMIGYQMNRMMESNETHCYQCLFQRRIQVNRYDLEAVCYRAKSLDIWFLSHDTLC